MHDDRQYLQYFTLTARPFYDLKDPRFVWLGEKQLETLARLKNGIEQRKGIALLTGDEGTGKSVLVDRFLRALPRDSVAVVLREPGSPAPTVPGAHDRAAPPAAGGDENANS